jgi:hypothetical protein
VKIDQDINFFVPIPHVAPYSPSSPREQFRDPLKSLDSVFWCHIVAIPVGFNWGGIIARSV